MKQYVSRVIYILFLIAAVRVFTDEPGYCLVQEDFVKFGKRDLYEEYRKMWSSEFSGVVALASGGKDETGHIYAIESEEDQEYFYLMPCREGAKLDLVFQTQQDAQKRASDDLKKRLQLFYSTVNFSIYSFLQYLPELSYTNDISSPYESQPYVHYWILSVAPGHEVFFETFLSKLKKDTMKKFPKESLRIWKVLIGSDVPKYVVASFSSTEKQLQSMVDSMQFVDASTKDVIRGQKAANGRVRPDLCLK